MATTTAAAAEPTHLYFWSAARDPFNCLSNFYAAPIRFWPQHVVPAMRLVLPDIDAWLGANGQTFATSEALWQALKAKNRETFLKFTVGGDYSGNGVRAFYSSLFPTQPLKAEKKAMYWIKLSAPGVVPKLATNKKYGNRLDLLEVLDYTREQLEPATERAIWLAILEQKFKQNTGCRRILCGTHAIPLIEFEKGAVRQVAAGKRVHWGGYRTPDGNIVGENAMGEYLMVIRDLAPHWW